MTPSDPRTLPALKLIETVAMLGVAVVARGVARLIDDHAMLLLHWTKSGNTAEARTTTSTRPRS
jgi:hypothetical protein